MQITTFHHQKTTNSPRFYHRKTTQNCETRRKKHASSINTFSSRKQLIERTRV